MFYTLIVFIQLFISVYPDRHWHYFP